MYAAIKSMDELSGSTVGKTSRVNSRIPLSTIDAPSGPPKRLLQIEAREVQEPFEYRGEFPSHIIARELKLHLDQEEVKEVFLFALKNGLFDSRIDQRLRTAYKQIVDLAHEFEIDLANETQKEPTSALRSGNAKRKRK